MLGEYSLSVPTVTIGNSDGTRFTILLTSPYMPHDLTVISLGSSHTISFQLTRSLSRPLVHYTSQLSVRSCHSQEHSTLLASRSLQTPNRPPRGTFVSLRPAVQPEAQIDISATTLRTTTYYTCPSSPCLSSKLLEVHVTCTHVATLEYFNQGHIGVILSGSAQHVLVAKLQAFNAVLGTSAHGQDTVVVIPNDPASPAVTYPGSIWAKKGIDLAALGKYKTFPIEEGHCRYLSSSTTHR